MFGYVRPILGKLSEEDKAAYQAAYCGLCHCLKKDCGLAARFTLNYDFVFLFLLLDGGAGDCKERRCPAHPLQGRPCLAQNETMALCAWESVILTYYKLGDGVADEGFLRRTGDRLAKGLLRRAYQRTLAHCPDFDRHVAACLGELDELERENAPKLDRTADAFARLLSAAAPETGDETLDRPRRQLLYHLGRWIYLTDALDDREEDLKRGRYNPITARFGQEPELEYLTTTMSHSLSLAQSAFQLLPRTAWSGILENILYLGLPHVQELVAQGRWDQKEDKHGRRHHE